MPTIDIPRFDISKVEIHEIPLWKTDIQTLNNISKPIVDIPGCVRVHRNNLTSLIDSDKDEYGTYTECGNFSIPSFEPLQYNPNEFVYTQSETPQNQEQEFVQPTVEPPKYEPKKRTMIRFLLNVLAKKINELEIIVTNLNWSVSLGMKEAKMVLNV